MRASEEAFAKMVHRGIEKQPQTDVTSPKGNWPTSATLPDGELAGETDVWRLRNLIQMMWLYIRMSVYLSKGVEE